MSEFHSQSEDEATISSILGMVFSVEKEEETTITMPELKVLVRTNLCVPKGEDKRTNDLDFNVNINVDWGLRVSKYPGIILTY